TPGTQTGAAHERFWRSIAEADARPESTVASKDSTVAPLVNRRAFMKIMGASLALATAGCSHPPLHKIIPYRDGPAQQTYGHPVFYATGLPHDGYGIGVLVETNMGRPTKIEGNPRHPASGGATDVFRQAQVLELWDPDRSQSVRNGRNVAAWTDFLQALDGRMRAMNGRGGHGLRVLTGMVTSPSLHAQLIALLQRYPQARWHQWQPVNRDNVHAGSALAHGTRADTLCRFDQARVVLAVDGDFLDQHPHFVRYALDFASTREARTFSHAWSRLYALECTPSLTGANADHRLPLRASDMEAALQQIAHALGMTAPPARAVIPEGWVAAAVADLREAAGASIITAGARQPPRVHALVHAMNEHLGSVGRTVTTIASAATQSVDHAASLRELVQAINEGAVDVLLLSGVNPVYDAPADLDFAAALSHVAFKVHHGLYLDETGTRCDWHVPAAHALESWGDLRSFDGTITLQQPCIAPLYGGKSTLELIAAAAGDV